MDVKSCFICGSNGPPLFRFPREKKRLTQWLESIRRMDLLKISNYYSVVYNNARLCNSHFADWCFTGADKKRLIKHAMPQQVSPIEESDLGQSENVQISSSLQKNNSGITPKNCEDVLESPADKQNWNVLKKDSALVPADNLNSTNVNKGIVFEPASSMNCVAVKKEPGIRNDKDTLREKNMDQSEENKENYAEDFDCNLEPERIIGATDVLGQLMFLIKWKDLEEATLVPSVIANTKYPEMVIEFYEDRLTWITKTD